nr:hypothetical protein [Candidatus Electrothrix aestuarii]
MLLLKMAGTRKKNLLKVTATAALQNGSITERSKKQCKLLQHPTIPVCSFLLFLTVGLSKNRVFAHSGLKKAKIRLESVRHQAATTLINEKKCLLGISDN